MVEYLDTQIYNTEKDIYISVRTDRVRYIIHVHVLYIGNMDRTTILNTEADYIL